MLWWCWLLVVLAVPATASNLERAVKALEKEDWAAAVPWLEKVVLEEPENVEVQFNLAYCYSQLRQNKRAVMHYRKVVALKPELSEAHMNLGMILMEQDAISEAMPHFRTAKEAWPDKLAPVLYYAHALLETGEVTGAVEAYQNAISVDPLAADAHLGLGKALLHSGRLEEAPLHYERATELDPELHSMQLELAEHLAHHGAPQKALNLYRRYLAANPESIAVHQRVGFLLLELKQYPEAIKFFEQAVQSNSTISNHIALAEAYLNTDETAKALPHLREAATVKDADPALRLRYANLLLHNEEFTEAAHHYLALLEKTPHTVVAWNGLAFAMYKNKDLAGALNALTQSVRVGAPKPAQIYLRAIIEDKLELRKEALASYLQFLAYNSGLKDEEWKAQERIKVIEKFLKRR